MEKARHILQLREKLCEQDRTLELSKLDKDALNKYRRQRQDHRLPNASGASAAPDLLSDKERERSSSEMEKSTDDLGGGDLDSVLDLSSNPSTRLVVKCLKLMLSNRRETRARLLAAVRHDVIILHSRAYVISSTRAQANSASYPQRDSK